MVLVIAFLFSILKNDPKTMTDLLFKAMKYSNVADTMITQEEVE